MLNSLINLNSFKHDFFFFLQGSPIPAITVTDEHANTLTVTEEQTAQEMERENTENQPQITEQESEVVKTVSYLITGLR